MTRAVFITADGERMELDCRNAPTMMRVAVENGVPGIDADCGGSMVCGTCHVHVADAWLGTLPEKSEMEAEILDCVPEPHPHARLSCQIQVSAATDGIELTIPRSQR